MNQLILPLFISFQRAKISTTLRRAKTTFIDPCSDPDPSPAPSAAGKTFSAPASVSANNPESHTIYQVKSMVSTKTVRFRVTDSLDNQVKAGSCDQIGRICDRDGTQNTPDASPEKEGAEGDDNSASQPIEAVTTPFKDKRLCDEKNEKMKMENIRRMRLAEDESKKAEDNTLSAEEETNCAEDNCKAIQKVSKVSSMNAISAANSSSEVTDNSRIADEVIEVTKDIAKINIATNDGPDNIRQMDDREEADCGCKVGLASNTSHMQVNTTATVTVIVTSVLCQLGSYLELSTQPY